MSTKQQSKMTNLHGETRAPPALDYSSLRQAHYDSCGRSQNRLNDIDKSTYVDMDKLAPSEDADSVYPKKLEQSYERDSRWKPHLSWSFLSWSLQQKMEEQATRREMAWQRISDKLGPLLLTEGGCKFGLNDLESDSIDEKAFERVPFIYNNPSSQNCPRPAGGRFKHNINQCQSLADNKLYQSEDRFTLNGRCDSGLESQLGLPEPSSIGSRSPDERTSDDEAIDAYMIRQSSISDYGGLNSCKYSSTGGRISKLSSISAIMIECPNEKISPDSVRQDDVPCHNQDRKVSSYSLLKDRHENDEKVLAECERSYNEEAKYYEHHKKARKRCMTVAGVLISLILLLFTIVILMGFGVLKCSQKVI